MTNPLLALTASADQLPDFNAIQPTHAEPALDQVLSSNRELISKLLTEQGNYSWDSLVAPLEEMDDGLSKMFSPVSHLNAVMNSPEWRDAYNACIPKLSEYSSEIGQNSALCAAYQQVADSDKFSTLDIAQQKIIRDALRDFRLSGVDLSDEKKQRFTEISQRLAELSTKYEENILDSTNAWQKHITDVGELAGLPDSSLAMLQQAAETRLPEGQQQGWLVTLDFPSYFAINTHADNRELREELYRAYNSRASEQTIRLGGDDDGVTDQWNNLPLMAEMLELRQEAAELIGMGNHAEVSLASKMAGSIEQVVEFLQQLAAKAKPQAEQDLAELRQFALEQDGINDLQAWDVGYYSEKLRQQKYAVSDEELRPYFPANRVIEGMFDVVQRLFSIRIAANTTLPTWHSDVQAFDIFGADNSLIGQFYTDLYARQHKRGGAWMADCRNRKQLQQSANDSLQKPVAFLTCNFTPPVGDQPALLTHSEVETLFHEFGHGLHHMLTKIRYPSAAGINGVQWDAVELPSQFLENWCWQREALNVISGHVDSGEPLPDELFERMLAAKHFQSGMFLVRQLEFSLFDMRIHSEYQRGQTEAGQWIYDILTDVRDQVSVIQPPTWNRFPNNFSHIFAGGYSAGYFSYLWAEVLSCDAFSAFEENGVFDPATGRRFLECILERGGSQDMAELFADFRGREPSIEPLLRQHGLAAD